MTTYTDKIGEWTEKSAGIANEIASEYGDYIEIQKRALEIMGGEILPSHTWGEFAKACAKASEELS